MLPPELAHELALAFLRRSQLKILPETSLQPSMTTSLPHIGALPHPIGLAAGFDKNANCVNGLLNLGLAFVEVGTLTPRPQAGNPKPRLFRLSEERALVNRMGFNNAGFEEAATTLATYDLKQPVGINIGKNKDTPIEQALLDYSNGIQKFGKQASYIVVNVSSPNTPGLRSLAEPKFFQDLALNSGATKQKIWIKLDPDSPKKTFQMNVESIQNAGFGGLVLSNTHRVERPYTGGLSGHPLLSASNSVLEWAWEVHQGKLPMIGVGGILSGADIYQKMIRGASAVQIYTALIYRGPFVVEKLLSELKEELSLRGVKSVSEIVGSYYER
jgi:dihydroorotate dehydrogenase